MHVSLGFRRRTGSKIWKYVDWSILWSWKTCRNLGPSKRFVLSCGVRKLNGTLLSSLVFVSDVICTELSWDFERKDSTKSNRHLDIPQYLISIATRISQVVSLWRKLGMFGATNLLHLCFSSKVNLHLLQDRSYFAICQISKICKVCKSRVYLRISNCQWFFRDPSWISPHHWGSTLFSGRYFKKNSKSLDWGVLC